MSVERQSVFVVLAEYPDHSGAATVVGVYEFADEANEALRIFNLAGECGLMARVVEALFGWPDHN